MEDLVSFARCGCSISVNNLLGIVQALSGAADGNRRAWHYEISEYGKKHVSCSKDCGEVHKWEACVQPGMKRWAMLIWLFLASY